MGGSISPCDHRNTGHYPQQHRPIELVSSNHRLCFVLCTDGHRNTGHLPTTNNWATDYQFPVRVVKVPSASRVPLEGVKLLIHGYRFCLTAQVPPRILQTWNVADLRRYGAVDGKFCFEGGSKCGKGVGVHAVHTEQAEEISEILRVNSLGNSSATPQSPNNRNSQLLDYSLVTPDPVWGQDRPGGPGSGPGASAVGGDQLPRPVCCQGLPAGGEMDEWGCRKRHSVNVTEYHRASVATFQETLRQMSLENQERQRLMAIYDVPPKHPRKLETVSDSGSTHQPKEDESAASSVDPVSGPEVLESALKATSGLMVRLDPDTAASQGDVRQSPASSQSRRVIVTSVAGREYCVPRSLNTSVFDSIVNAQVDTTKRKEALQSLHKQETHLRQEIDLLDQMLKVCHPEGQTAQTEEESTIDSVDPWQDRIPTLESPFQCSTPNHVAQKTASLPPKMGNSGDAEGPANSPMSPNLLSKLDQIPWNSSLNAPLPYVNLAKYDAETDSGFIYLQGGSEADSGYMAAVPKLNRNPTGGSMASLRHRALMGVPSRSFSETHIGPGNGMACSLVAPQKPLPLPPKEESEEEITSEETSPCSDNLQEDDYLMPPTTFAPAVPYPRVLTTVSATSASTSVTESPLTDYTPIAAASTPTHVKPAPIREPIYANEPPPLPPPRCKLNTPPPELPPKGPALLQRSKLRSSGSGASITTTVPPAPPVRTRSLSVGSQGGRTGESDKPGSGSPPEHVKKNSGEQAYLPMGSPQSTPRRAHTDSCKAGDSRPSSLHVTSSPKTRAKAASSTARRGNAEVLSGYMDMANMFVEEPKHDPVEKVNNSESESVCARELYISEPIVDSGGEATVDSNYMEMSNFPVQPKSAVLKNLEALQSYISTTTVGEAVAKPGSSSSPGTPRKSNAADSSDVPTTPNTPPTKGSGKVSRKATTSSTITNSDDNVFTVANVNSEDVNTNQNVKCVSKSGKARPAIPFTNLKNFGQKQSKSYVNTYIPAPEVPLPEPPRKEEGFFARLMRRNSKDKSTSKSQESLNQQKNRTSVFERSISEQVEIVDEKMLSRVKAGRRRSASFPNRLSFHETAVSEGSATTPKTDAPPPLPPTVKLSSSVRSSSSTRSSLSVKSLSSLKSSSSTKSCSSPTKSSSKLSRSNAEDVNSKPQADNRSDNSSLQDLSDDSDRAPLLRQGSSSNNSELRVLTVLHVQQELNVSPMAQICTRLTSCSSSDPLFTNFGDSCPSKLSDSSVSLSDCSKAASSDSFKTALSDSSKTALSNSSRTKLSDSSKTDDEKLIELLKCGQKSLVASTETGEVSAQVNTPQDQQSVINAQEEAAAIARHVASVPPLIPPKNKRLPLSPVSEVSSPGTLSLSSPSPSSPPQHPLLPSAPNQDEAIYVDMKELLPQPPRGSATASAAGSPAHLHPYNCPREQKERARATLRITPAMEDEEGNIWVPRRDAGGVRPRSVAVFESPLPARSLSSKLHPAFSHPHPSPRLGGEAPSSPFELRYTTPLVVSVDPLEGAGEGLAEPLSVSSQGSCPSLRSLDDTVIIRASPASTVLRPRSGRDYQVVERRRLGSESLSSSPATQSPMYSSVFTYEASLLPHKSPASHSAFSWQSRDTASPSCQAMSTGTSTPLSSRERTPPTPSSASLSLSATPSPRVRARRDAPPLPPRKVRVCHRAHSEPWSGRTDFPRVVCHSARSSPPSTPQAPISPLTLAHDPPHQPALNYAEIDLTAMASTPPPVELTRHLSRRQKKAPLKPVAIEYTQIDHTATTALKRAGQEHAQSREDNNSLRRGGATATHISLARKNSAPASTKDRKIFYSSYTGERKLSTCSMDSA
ncbi:hypothetical protein ACOMHN_014788 [Nucella lapillus]